MDELESIITISDDPDFKRAPQNLEDALGPVVIGITDAEHHSRAQYALGLPLPSIIELQDKYLNEKCMIIGGGMSIDLDDVRAGITNGVRVCAVNCAHDWLIKKDILPDFSVMLDPAERIAEYQTPTQGVKYLLGTSMHPSVWNTFRMAGIDPYIFIPLIGGNDDNIFAKRWPDAKMCVVAGVTTVGLRAANVMATLGFSEIHFHGFDSCYAPNNDGVASLDLYRYAKPLIRHDTRRITLVSKRTRDMFTCISTGAMGRQAIGLHNIIEVLPEMSVNERMGGVKYLFAGDGACPWMAWKDANDWINHLYPWRMYDKYGEAKHWDYEKGMSL
jgi:hypothetical protein